MRRIPQRIGNVEIHDALAEGGMGVVYLGVQPVLGRTVVVKGLRHNSRSEASSIERFRREARAMASIQHQNVVAVLDAFDWRQEPWIVQEYVDGFDLHALLARHGSLPPRLAALIAASILLGLEEIHARGIIHRDLKPSNVLLGRNGEVKICDFGIAIDDAGPGLTRTGFALGTAGYMAPEQMLGEVVDFRGDLFSVGVLLYEMLCGELPFAVKDPEGTVSLVRRIQTQKYQRCRKARSDIPRWLAGLTERCLRAKPRRRAGSTTQIRRELERRLGHPSPADLRTEIAGFLAPSLPVQTVGPIDTVDEGAAAAETIIAAVASSSTSTPTWAKRALGFAVILLIAVVAAAALLAPRAASMIGPVDLARATAAALR